MTTSIFAFIIVLGVLIFFHELGHFLIARLFGVGVQTFSLGFGPRILGKKVGITDYRISAIPSIRRIRQNGGRRTERPARA
jgi:regulator of sigma E protease